MTGVFPVMSYCGILILLQYCSIHALYSVGLGFPKIKQKQKKNCKVSSAILKILLHEIVFCFLNEKLFEMDLQKLLLCLHFLFSTFACCSYAEEHVEPISQLATHVILVNNRNDFMIACYRL